MWSDSARPSPRSFTFVCGRSCGATAPRRFCRRRTSTESGIRASDRRPAIPANRTTRRRPPCGGWLRSANRLVRVHHHPHHSQGSRVPGFQGSDTHTHTHSQNETSDLTLCSASRHRTDRVSGHETCCGRLWTLLLQPTGHVLCCGEDHQGTGSSHLCLSDGPVRNTHTNPHGSTHWSH